MPKTIKVLFEDDDLIVFDKPAGLLTIPSPKKENNTLIAIVNTQHAANTPYRLHPCHRLDRETSGAILFAKGKRGQQLMRREFYKHAIQKKYIAFVKGQLRQTKGELRFPISDIHQKRFTKRSHPKLAITRFKVQAVRKQFSVVEVVPVTGRTNQIRIQFRDIGHPLLGERVYAFGREFPIHFRRLALHSFELSWRHPISRKFIRVTSPLPEDMHLFLERHV